MRIHQIFHRYMAPVGSGEGGGNEVIDRGDDWTPTDDDAAQAARLDDPAKKVEATEEGDAAAVEKLGLGAKKADAKEEGEEGAGSEETDPKAKKVEGRIPAARHKEILDAERARRTAVETELAKYRQGAQIADVNAEITEAETKLVSLEAKYSKLMADGEIEKATSTMTEIRRTERAINAKTSEMRETAATARAVEQVRFDTTVDRLEALYPALDVKSEDFDKAKTAEVLEMKEAWEAKGYTPSQALQKAVKYVMPPTTKAQETALSTEARVDSKKIEAERKSAAVAKTVEAVKATPASGTKVGKDHDAAGGGTLTAKDVIKMTYKDFSGLNEEALARARGDIL